MGKNKSVSKSVSVFCKTEVILSKPKPVSIFCLGKGVNEPSSSRLYCINTKFHNSRYLSSTPTPPPSFDAFFSPKSIYISEHGPQGPVGPTFQKLSFSPNLTILFSERPIMLCQILWDSSSSSNMETHNLSSENPI